ARAAQSRTERKERGAENRRAATQAADPSAERQTALMSGARLLHKSRRGFRPRSNCEARPYCARFRARDSTVRRRLATKSLPAKNEWALPPFNAGLISSTRSPALTPAA